MPRTSSCSFSLIFTSNSFGKINNKAFIIGSFVSLLLGKILPLLINEHKFSFKNFLITCLFSYVFTNKLNSSLFIFLRDNSIVLNISVITFTADFSFTDIPFTNGTQELILNINFS